MSARINAFLKLGRQQGGSDIHFAVGTPPLVRLHGELIPIKYRELSDNEIEELTKEILSPVQIEQFEKGNDLDFSYDDEEVGRFRVNMFRKVTGIGASFRAIAPKIPTFADLKLPPVIEKFLHATQGLILVTGATGTGKSTTLAAMIDWINANRRYNIITRKTPLSMSIVASSPWSSSARWAPTSRALPRGCVRHCAKTRISSWWASCGIPIPSPWR